MGIRWTMAVAGMGMLAVGCGSDDGGDGGSAMPTPDDCITDVSANDKHVFSCDGLTYNVSVPEACTEGGCGLIFDVHGFSMSGDMQDANTELARRGREHGYLVVQPSATPAPPLSSWSAEEDDPKMLDFMQRMITAFVVDEDRIHFTGFSQGGFMTWRFLCDHGDMLASVAPAAASADSASCISDGQPPANPIPVLQIQGTSDSLVSYDSAVASRDALIASLGLEESATLSEDDAHSRVRYENAAGDLFEFIEHDYGGAQIGDGHCFPGSTDTGGAEGQIFPFTCSTGGPSAFVWGEEVMQFFLDHPRAAAK